MSLETKMYNRNKTPIFKKTRVIFIEPRAVTIGIYALLSIRYGQYKVLAFTA